MTLPRTQVVLREKLACDRPSSNRRRSWWDLSHRAQLSRALVTVCLGWLSASCDRLTHVTPTGVLPLPGFDTPQGALQFRNTAITSFATALSDQVLGSGIITDEFHDVTGSFPPDRRLVSVAQGTNADTPFPYSGLSIARVNALLAIHKLERYNPTPAWRIGELFAYVALVETYFAEDMCSGVPLGVVTTDIPSAGPGLTRGQLLATALHNLDSAAHYAAGSDSIRALVSIARGRALLDSANFAAAAAAVTGVSTAYVFQAQYDLSSNVLNDIYNNINLGGSPSVSDSEGINGLPFISANDPRVPKDSLFATTFGVAWISSVSSPLTVASGIEARLIEAEAALNAGQASAWLSDLNALRADTADTKISGLGPLTDPGTADTRVALMFHERAFWLFATGHRQGDMRRLIREYGRATESVFPTGLYEGGPFSYGTDVTFIPTGEQTNPYFTSCFNRDP